ncbi:hypothetical protein VK70_00570 [Paenibacillus durus ATCC 35681]|uniref:Uncharacterized protein n=1 Tax=Paenibacillus durus ATCC 35681 TaxID=1333534 RepID=A0A0F7F7D8_PAEDU|nr:hypothetical protein VK70_00570 [Paenibacillus durus ATCC 35681]
MGKNYRSELVGAFGCPIDENPTGVMEEAAFQAKGLWECWSIKGRLILLYGREWKLLSTL